MGKKKGKKKAIKAAVKGVLKGVEDASKMHIKSGGNISDIKSF